MPRPVSRRLIVAAVLVALAVLPNVVNVNRDRFDPDPNSPFRPDKPERPVVRARVLYWDLFHFEATSVERAKSVGYWWEQYRRYSWVLAAIAACIFVRAFLPVPRLSGHDDE